MSDVCSDVKARLRAQIASIEQKPVTPMPILSTVVVLSDEIEINTQGVADEKERAFRKIERLCCMREQASEQIRRRLLREGFCEEAVEHALARSLVCGLVDDIRFAEVLMRCRLAAGRGRQGVEAELSGLGIDPYQVTGWPEAFAVDYESELARALALLDRKPPRAKNRREAAYRRIAQKGFGSSVASTAARIWVEQNPE